MPVIFTQDLFKIGALDTVHINPSIMEGERFYSAILGPKVAVRITRYAPVFIVSPSITGDFKIPSLLTCNPGVNDSSPKALIYYQWQVDGVDIPGETGSTLWTSLPFDTFTLTCVVTVVNFLGVAVATSNGITAQIVEPIINQENLQYVLTGLTQEKQQNLMKGNTYITTGTAMDTRLDTEQDIVMIGTGMWVDDEETVFDQTVYNLTGLNKVDQKDLYGIDVYTTWIPTFHSDLIIPNGDAELGTTANWTVTTGGISSVTSAPSSPPLIGGSTRFFRADDFNPQEESEMFQVVTMDIGTNVDVDAGNMLYLPSMIHGSQYGWDNVSVEIDFLDAADVSLGGGVLMNPSSVPINHGWWMHFEDVQSVPALARKVKFTVHFYFLNSQTSDVNGYLDKIMVQFYTAP